MPEAIQKFISKQIEARIKVLDDKAMILDHCISDDTFDRVDDDINQDGWDFKNYMRNPVVLDGHDYSKNPVGKCLKLYKDGNCTRAITQFAPTAQGTEKFQLYKDGFLSAFSVGFIPKEYAPNKAGGYHIEKQELLEYSCVTVPCNPNAVKSFLTENADPQITSEGGEDMPNLKELIEQGSFDHEGKTYLIAEKIGATLSSKTKESLKSIHAGIMEHCSKLEQMCADAAEEGEEDKEKELRAEIEKELREQLDGEYAEKLASSKSEIENNFSKQLEEEKEKLMNEAQEAIQQAIDLYKENFNKGLKEEE